MAIPLHKLASLPRHQLLRKLVKIFTDAEKRFSQLDDPQLRYLFDAAALAGFSPCARNDAPGEAEDSAALLRDINSIRHALLAETGRFCADWDFIDHDGVLDSSKRRPFSGMHVYLEDIRSPFNVGAIFRSAESFGVEKIFLSAYCADPLHPRSRRSAMGCVEIMPWERIETAAACGGPVFALETGGIALKEFPFPRRGCMIVGSEELGVSPAALDLADASLGRLCIPGRGAKASLNVSVAFGIAAQAWAAYLAENENRT